MGPQDFQAYESVSDALRDFYFRSHRLIDRIMTEKGASFARTKILIYIARHGPVRSADVATTFGYAPRTVTEAIDGLERDGLVRRDADPHDRRAKRISLTPAGTEASEGAEASRVGYIESVYGGLTAAECAAIVAILGKLSDRLDELGG